MGEIQLDVQDIIMSLTGQVAEKAGQIAVLEAKVLALTRLLEPEDEADDPEPFK